MITTPSEFLHLWVVMNPWAPKRKSSSAPLKRKTIGDGGIQFVSTMYQRTSSIVATQEAQSPAPSDPNGASKCPFTKTTVASQWVVVSQGNLVWLHQKLQQMGAKRTKLGITLGRCGFECIGICRLDITWSGKWIFKLFLGFFHDASTLIIPSAAESIWEGGFGAFYVGIRSPRDVSCCIYVLLHGNLHLVCDREDGYEWYLSSPLCFLCG